jgi:short-subunit dehydrogenase
LGLVALPGRGAYSATKFALESLTDTLRIENVGSNLHFILIEPGPVTSLIRQNSIAHFERWIDWKNSAHKERYDSKWMPRLYDGSGTPDKWELPASAVSDKLLAALTTENPQPRYFVTKPTYLMNILRRILPTRLLDRATKDI